MVLTSADIRTADVKLEVNKTLLYFDIMVLSWNTSPIYDFLWTSRVWSSICSLPVIKVKLMGKKCSEDNLK